MTLEDKVTENLAYAETCADDGNFQATENFIYIAEHYAAKNGTSISARVSELKNLVYTKALESAERYSEAGNIPAANYFLRQIEKYAYDIKDK
ncbi:MAG: hypothetical protein NTV63_04185 [Candidatus Woesearchaeota archaeon]|nr:hypothetical protein [Candidatus Woesearchaeota archaeon]